MKRGGYCLVIVSVVFENGAAHVLDFTAKSPVIVVVAAAAAVIVPPN